MAYYFVSDLHLCNDRAYSNTQFITFLNGAARGAVAVYILGDLLEYWVGDDTLEHDIPVFIAALRALTNSGVAVFVMHGNRDFLLGSGFETATGAQLISDPWVISLYGTPTLLMHGDTLCSDDTDYQNFRCQVRDARWQKSFLSLPWDQRVAMAHQVRAQSKDLTRAKLEYITDVNQTAVENAMRTAGVTQLIHGHTHRPAVHNFLLDGKQAQRIVLPDWYEQGGVLAWDEQGYRSIAVN